jgi:hypothetical protein
MFMENQIAEHPVEACHSERHAIHFVIDQQRFVTDQPHQTPRSLLEFFAGEDPKETTLVLKVPGHEPRKYTNPDEQIEVTEHAHYVVYHNTACVVS